MREEQEVREKNRLNFSPRININISVRSAFGDGGGGGYCCTVQVIGPDTKVGAAIGLLSTYIASPKPCKSLQYLYSSTYLKKRSEFGPQSLHSRVGNRTILYTYVIVKLTVNIEKMPFVAGGWVIIFMFSPGYQLFNIHFYSIYSRLSRSPQV